MSAKKVVSNKLRFAEMIINAIFNLGERKGSSRQAIWKFICSRFPEANTSSRSYQFFAVSLKRASADGKFVQKQGDKANRFKLDSKFRKKYMVQMAKGETVHMASMNAMTTKTKNTKKKASKMKKKAMKKTKKGKKTLAKSKKTKASKKAKASKSKKAAAMKKKQAAKAKASKSKKAAKTKGSKANMKKKAGASKKNQKKVKASKSKNQNKK